jgi:hypothetical protein
VKHISEPLLGGLQGGVENCGSEWVQCPARYGQKIIGRDRCSHCEGVGNAIERLVEPIDVDLRPLNSTSKFQEATDGKV